jgi:actin-like ATPase involved in cell morphogenesis
MKLGARLPCKCVVAIQCDRRGNRRVLAVGTEGKEMIDRTAANIEAVRPFATA